MDEETVFLRGILADPEDEALPLAFLDWLAKQGRWPGDGENAEVGCGHDYPQHHRLCDIRLHGEPFRVTRCVICGERLHAFRIANGAWGSRSGVPLWLQGEALQQWIADELAAQEDEEKSVDSPTDWDQYR